MVFQGWRNTSQSPHHYCCEWQRNPPPQLVSVYLSLLLGAQNYSSKNLLKTTCALSSISESTDDIPETSSHELLDKGKWESSWALIGFCTGEIALLGYLHHNKNLSQLCCFHTQKGLRTGSKQQKRYHTESQWVTHACWYNSIKIQLHSHDLAMGTVF